MKLFLSTLLLLIPTQSYAQELWFHETLDLRCNDSRELHWTYVESRSWTWVGRATLTNGNTLDMYTERPNGPAILIIHNPTNNYSCVLAELNQWHTIGD